jgi:Sulfotransferase family
MTSLLRAVVVVRPSRTGSVVSGAPAASSTAFISSRPNSNTVSPGPHGVPVTNNVPSEAFARRMASVPIRWWRDSLQFSDLKAFCIFIGYQRSGHSLVGALLDAHPEAVIAHELGALALFEQGMGRREVYRRILHNARQFAASGANPRPGYELRVPGGWQGRFARLRVVGDKAGGESSRVLAAEPNLVPRLERKLRVPVRIVHVVRNPYDNIASILRKPNQRRLNRVSERHFDTLRLNARLRKRLGNRVMDVRHEELVAAPQRELTRLCQFLELEPIPAYLEACARVVFDSPRQSRREVIWPPKLVAKVDKRIARYDFLAGYSLNDQQIEPE